MKLIDMFLVLFITLLFSCITTKNAIVKEEYQFSAVALVKTAENIDVMVDPNVEMMSIIQHLAGQQPYVSAKDDPYIAKVDEYFEPYKDSSAVTMFRKNLMAYHRPLEFGMYLNSDDSDFIMNKDNEYFVVSEGPAKKIPYYYFPTLREAVREFRIESKYDQFFLSNTKDYEERIAKHIRLLRAYDFDSWLTDFYGIKQKENPCLYVTKLSGNYGISFVNPNGEIVPHAVVKLQPSPDQALYVIPHEFSHPMTRKIVDELYKNDAIRRIFDDQYIKNAIFYNSYGYGSGYSILIETITQACANKFNERNFPENIRQFLSSYEVETLKMVYIPAVTKFLDSFQNNRNTYKTFNDFVPELKKFLVTLE